MGRDPLLREAIVVDLWRKQRAPPASVPSARSTWRCGISLGKAMGQPIHRLLGTYREAVPVYASSAPFWTSAEAYAEEAVQFKGIRLGSPKIHPADPLEGRHQGVRAVRRAVGDFTIMLDSTWSYDFPAALRVGRAVEEMGFHWYEIRSPTRTSTTTSKLKQRLSDPDPRHRVSDHRLDGYQPWIMLQATDFLRGDVAVKGGITTLVKGAHLASRSA